MSFSARRLLPLLLSLGLAPICLGCGDDSNPAGTPSAGKDVGAVEASKNVGKAPPPSALPSSKRPSEDAIPAGAVSRWYDDLMNGQKAGAYHVVWVQSTWQGHPTVRDTTTVTSSTARDMAGTVDVFESTTVMMTERGVDGTLWWSKSVFTQARNRKTTSETTWTGAGYDYVARLNGVEEKKHVATPTPVQLDAESFLGPKIVSGEAKPGSKWTIRVLNVRAERVQEQTLEVLGVEPGPSESGADVPCTKVRQVDPETQAEVLLWIDGDGAVARVKESRSELRRVSRDTARERPTEPATFSITAQQFPPIDRIFSAERVLVDVHLRADPDRPLPDFPASPWSRVTGVEGNDKEGHVIHVEMKAYDAPDAHATIPVTDPVFKKDLESTLLLCTDQPDVVTTARKVVGDEKDARKAAQKIADYVFTMLRKEAPSVGNLSAVEILRERKGYCSDHCVLFTALCRAVGIPARRCSGFVCVGSIWGAHAWSEIWTGAWMGVDPTTADVGTAARYLFYGYSDDPTSHPDVVSNRALERMRFEVRHLDEGEDHIDLSDADTWTFFDAEKKVASQRLAGLEFRDWPADWSIDLENNGKAFVRGPNFAANIVVYPDQGYRGVRYLRRDVAGREDRFSGAPAVVFRAPGRRSVGVSSRRRVVRIDLSTHDESADADAILTTLEKVMKRTFTPRP